VEIMAAITSSVAGAQTAAQAGWQQLKLQQARQNAERAEATAQALAVRASEAQRVADREQENARSLSSQAGQAESVAGRARQGVAMLRSTSDMQSQLANRVDQAAERQGVQLVKETESASEPVQARGGLTGNYFSESAARVSAPVVNLSGQMTGVVVNTTA
jgi:hypothetical protein